MIPTIQDHLPFLLTEDVFVKAPKSSTQDQVGEAEEGGIKIVAWGRFELKEHRLRLRLKS
jgi:hypothetical protein